MIKKAIICLALSLGLLAPSLLAPASVSANYLFDDACTGMDEAVCKPPGDLFGPAGSFMNIINILIIAIGAVSALMIVVGGLRYTLSGGDQGSLKGAKDTILYAVIGLMLAVIAFAIVNFVLANI